MSTPTHRTATTDDVGRSCPYCRFPLKSGAGVTDCGTCRATHHDDCWEEGGGCAVVGCGATSDVDPTLVAPAAGATQQTGSGPVSPPPGSPPPAWAPPPGQTAASGGRGTGMIVAAVLILALVVAGSAAAFVLTRDTGDDATAAVLAAETTTAGDATTTSDEGGTTTDAAASTGDTGSEPEEATEAESSGALPDVSEREMAGDIATAISGYYGALNVGDTDTAWNLLSGRRHRLETSNRTLYNRVRTRASWNESELRTGQAVSPGSVTATIVELDRSNGVATVRIKGLDFTGPNAARCNGEYRGITWAKYEYGEWKYEPGTNTTAKREARWPGAATDPRLLGNTCN